METILKQIQVEWSGGVCYKPNCLKNGALSRCVSPTIVASLQNMGRKIKLAKVAQHVNDFGMEPVGKLKEGDIHSSGLKNGKFNSL